MRLSVVVPATDRPSALPSCLAALHASGEPPHEILVVDRPAGGGAAAARNEGAARASGDVLVFVDADVEVRGDALERIRRRFEDEPDLTALFGSYDDSPAAPGLVSRFRNLLHHHVHQSSPGRAETFWAGLGAIRRDAFVAAGGFRRGPFPDRWLEDVELGMRLAHAGARIELDPAIQGTHLKRWTLGTMLWTDFARRGIPWVVLALERRGPPRVPNLTLRRSAAAALSLAAATALVRRRPLAAAAALAGIAALDPPFYALLARRLGVARAAAATGLHALHYLAAAAAVPAGAAVHLARRRAQTGSGRSSSASTAAPSSRYSSSVLTDQTS